MAKAFCACALLLALISCSGGSSTPPSTPTPTATPVPNVSVSPSVVTLGLNAHQAFTATGPNGQPVTVTWSVSVGNAPGTIDQKGNYTAPSFFPGPASPITVTITAALQSTPATKGTAQVTVEYPNDNRMAQTVPVMLGTSGGNATDKVTTSKSTTCCSGTLGSLIQRGSTFYILSNNHVLDKSDTGTADDPIDQPGLVDNNCSPGTTVANLSEHAALKPTNISTTGACAGQPAPCGPAPSNVDAAIAAIVPGQVDVSGTILDIGPALASSIGAAPPSATLANAANVLATNEGVAKSGRSTGLTCSILQSVATTVSVVYDASCGGATAFTATFANQVIINGGSFSAAGDSGSLIVTTDTARPVALLYGGNSTSTSANPIQDVIAAFTNGSGTPAIVGGIDRAVSCAPTTSNLSTPLAPSFAALSAQERARAAAAQRRNAPGLMQDPTIESVTAGVSEDNPQEAALVIHLSGFPRTPILAVIDGVRTKVIAAQTGPSSVPVLSAQEMGQAIAVKESHADKLMAQSGGVQGVGVGRSSDNPTEPAIVIYVITGMDRPLIPAVLNGIRTKIVEGDRFRAFGWGKETAPRAKCTKK